MPIPRANASQTAELGCTGWQSSAREGKSSAPLVTLATPTATSVYQEPPMVASPATRVTI